MTRKNISKNLQVVEKMPPLKHRAQGTDFNIIKSEVVQWLIKQPEVLQYLFDYINNTHLINYNSETGTWQGIDCEK